MHEAKKIGDIIAEFMRDDKVSEKLKSYQVVGDWEKIVGGAIARNTEISRIENGILFVKVSSGAWRNELVFMKSTIMRKIRQNYPDSGVDDIFFI